MLKKGLKLDELGGPTGSSTLHFHICYAHRLPALVPPSRVGVDGGLGVFC